MRMTIKQTSRSLSRIPFLAVTLTLLFFIGASHLRAQESDTSTAIVEHLQAPIENLGQITVTAADAPNDNGDRIAVRWIDPGYRDLHGFTGYEIFRQSTADGEFVLIGSAAIIDTSFLDEKAPTGEKFSYKISAVFGSQRQDSEVSMPVSSVVQWFNWGKISVVVIGLLVCSAVIYFIETAKRGKKLFLRRIAGLEAIDEAVGRATEMGRPVLFVAGTQDMDDVQTLAGIDNPRPRVAHDRRSTIRRSTCRAVRRS